MWLEGLGGGAVCCLQGGPREAPEGWVVFCFLICLLVIWMCSLCEVTELCICDWCTFLHAHCTSIKSLQEQQTGLNYGDGIQNIGDVCGGQGAGSMEKACRRLLGLMGTFYFLIWLVVTRVSSLCENSSSCKCVHFLYVHCISIKLTSSKILSGGREVISVTTSAQSTQTNKRTRGAAWPTRLALNLHSPCPGSLP